MTAPPGVILAGGLSTRMGGGDKGLLQIGSRSLLDHVIARLRPQVGEMMINANGDPARFSALGLPVRADSVPGHVGPLAGVLAGLDWAAELGATSLISVAADTPFFPLDLVARLSAAAEGMAHPLVLAATPDARRGMIRQPTFGLWPVALRDDLRTALEGGLRKVVIWTEAHDARTALFEDPGEPFFNVNTPEDLDRAQAIAEANP